MDPSHHTRRSGARRLESEPRIEKLQSRQWNDFHDDVAVRESLHCVAQSPHNARANATSLVRGAYHDVGQEKANRAVPDNATEANHFIAVDGAHTVRRVGQSNFHGSGIVAPKANRRNYRLVLGSGGFACNDFYSHKSVT